MKQKSILFLTPYPKGTAASQRFRFEQYEGVLKEAGYEVTYQSFLDTQTWKVLYQSGYGIRKLWGLLSGLASRKWIVNMAWRYDWVFIHREAAPLGPPWFEWWMTNVLRRKVIYDFDDAIWLENTTDANSLAARLKWHPKVGSICKWSYKVSCGNRYLADNAAQFSDSVVYNPTTIDTDHLHVPMQATNVIPVIGWTGTHSTLKYLKKILVPLKQLAAKQDFVFQVIADQIPDFDIPNLHFVKWSKDTEIADLNKVDIGVMPLEDNPWSRGKCGFKALQFMALEKPVLVSPVGVNDEIVEEGVSGFHCATDEEWVTQLERLLIDSSLRKQLGKAGRQKVVNEFSVRSNTANFLSLFQ